MQDNSKKVLLGILIAVGVLVAVSPYVEKIDVNSIFPKPGGGEVIPDEPAPNAPVSAGVVKLREVVSKAKKEHVRQLGELYLAFADVLSRTKEIQSSKLRNWMKDSDAYCIQGTDIVGNVPGFGAAKDEILKEAVGMEDRLLSGEDLGRVVTAFRVIARECGVQP